MYTYYIAGIAITDELYHDDLYGMTFGRRDQNELWHYQIKGAKHGVRRFQLENGELTPEGRRRYGVGDGFNSAASGITNLANKAFSAAKTSPEYRQESSYNSQKNSFGSNSTSSAKPMTSRTQTVKQATSSPQAVKTSLNSGKSAADKLFSGITSAVKSASTQPANQNGGGNQPYVSPEYQRELAYNSQKNVYPEAMTKENTVPENQITEKRITENIIPENQITEKRITENIIPEKRITENTIPGNETNAESQKEKKPGLFDRIGNAASGALDSAKQWGSQAVEDAGKWANQAKEDVSNTASKLGDAASNALDSAKDWASGRVEDVKGLANTPFARDAANTVNGAIDTVQDAAGNVADFVTGNRSREALDKAYSENINNGGNGDSPELDRAREAYNKTLPGMAEYVKDNLRDNVIPDVQERVGNAAKAVKDTFSDGSKEREELASARADMKNYKDDPEFISEFSKRYPEEAQQYLDEQKAAKERLEKAEKNYMDFSNNPVNTVARALNLPNNKGNWAFAVPGNEQYLQTMERGFIPKTDNIADWFTGNNYKRTVDKYNGYAADYDDLANRTYEYAREAERNGNPSQAQWFKDEGDYVKNVYGQEDRDVANANMNLYNNAPRQKIANAASSVAQWGSGAVDNGRKALERIFGKKK